MVNSISHWRNWVFKTKYNLLSSDTAVLHWLKKILYYIITPGKVYTSLHCDCVQSMDWSDTYRWITKKKKTIATVLFGFSNQWQWAPSFHIPYSLFFFFFITNEKRKEDWLVKAFNSSLLCILLDSWIPWLRIELERNSSNLVVVKSVCALGWVWFVRAHDCTVLV